MMEILSQYYLEDLEGRFKAERSLFDHLRASSSIFLGKYLEQYFEAGLKFGAN